MDHFWQLAPELLRSDADDRAVTAAILRKSNVDGYQLGATKVWLDGESMRQADACVGS